LIAINDFLLNFLVVVGVGILGSAKKDLQMVSESIEEQPINAIVLRKFNF